MKMWTALMSAALGIMLMASAAIADVYVRGYYKSDGTYVQPHYRSSPNSTTLDNWSTKGNINPYTGKLGTRNPYTISPSPYGRSTNPYYSPYDPYRNYLRRSNPYGN